MTSLLVSCILFINFSISNDKFSILKSLTIESSMDDRGYPRCSTTVTLNLSFNSFFISFQKYILEGNP